ncbi:MAG: hypothetical protein ACK55I_20465, partial [bacterium]
VGTLPIPCRLRPVDRTLLLSHKQTSIRFTPGGQDIYSHSSRAVGASWASTGDAVSLGNRRLAQQSQTYASCLTQQALRSPVTVTCGPIARGAGTKHTREEPTGSRRTGQGRGDAARMPMPDLRDLSEPSG